jgi:hypothetical protein
VHHPEPIDQSLRFAHKVALRACFSRLVEPRRYCMLKNTK